MNSPMDIVSISVAIISYATGIYAFVTATRVGILGWRVVLLQLLLAFACFDVATWNLYMAFST